MKRRPDGAPFLRVLENPRTRMQKFARQVGIENIASSAPERIAGIFSGIDEISDTALADVVEGLPPDAWTEHTTVPLLTDHMFFGQEGYIGTSIFLRGSETEMPEAVLSTRLFLPGFRPFPQAQEWAHAHGYQVRDQKNLVWDVTQERQLAHHSVRMIGGIPSPTVSSDADLMDEHHDARSIFKTAPAPIQAVDDIRAKRLGSLKEYTLQIRSDVDQSHAVGALQELLSLLRELQRQQQDILQAISGGNLPPSERLTLLSTDLEIDDDVFRSAAEEWVQNHRNRT